MTQIQAAPLQGNRADHGAKPDVVSVLIADDHTLIADAIAALLERSGRFAVRIAEDFEATLSSLAEAGRVDLVLLDLKMPGMTGLDSVKRVIESNQGGRVVLFSGNADTNFVERAIREGLSGLIPKTMGVKSLISAIDLVMSGQVFVPRLGTETVLRDSAPQAPTLTEREMFVLTRAAEGSINKEIAREMGVNEMTVKMHMRAICGKLNARNRTHASMIARELSLL